jgi:hypothetical protein
MAARQPLSLLNSMAEDMLDGHPGSSPTDLLGANSGSEDPSVHLWRTAARELLLATSELQRAVSQPWIGDETAAWYVVGDVAESLAAVLALDRLSGRIVGARANDRYLTDYLVAGDVVRLAKAWGHGSQVEDLTAAAHVEVAGSPLPIVLVRRHEDLVLAERRLAELVRPSTIDVIGDPAERPGLLAARALSAGQIRVAAQCIQLFDPVGDLAATLRGRIDLYRRLHASTVRVVDVMPRRSRLILLQQTEIATAIRQLHGEAMSIGVATRLSNAGGEVAIELGRALRHEAMTMKRLLVVAEEEGGAGPRPLTSTRNAFYRACKALADEPGITPERRADEARRLSRSRLTHALNGVAPARRAVRL